MEGALEGGQPDDWLIVCHGGESKEPSLSSPNDESKCTVLTKSKNKLLATQKHYVDQLVEFCKGFIEEVERDLQKPRRNIVTKERHVTGLVEFARLLQHIKMLNQNLYADLRMASNTDMYRVLERYASLLTVYQDYAASRIGFLAILRREGRLRQRLESFARRASMGSEVYLGLPLSHASSLALCLESFTRGCTGLESAVRELQRVQQQVDHEIFLFASNAALKQISKNWDKALTRLISSNRTFVKEATVYRVEGGKKIPARLLLMSDLLALGFPQNRPFYRYKLSNVFLRSGISARAVLESSIYIEAVKGNTTESLILETTSATERNDWIEHLNNSNNDTACVQTCKLCLDSTTAVLSLCAECHRHTCEKCFGAVKLLQQTGLTAKVCNKCSNASRTPDIDQALHRSGIAHQQLVMNELVQTEQTYVDGLERCWKRFCKPLLDDFKNGSFKIGSEVLSLVNKGNSASILVFLASVKQILLLNQLILSDLHELQVNWGVDSSIASLFIKYGKLLKLYSEYAGSFSFSSDAFAEHILTNRKFRCFLGADSALFQSLLISPIQRCPRYALMLKELLKCTEPSAREHIALVESLSVVEDINAFINEHVRLRENLVIMFELEAAWGAIVHGKSFVHQGDLLKISRKKNIEYRFLLFTDCLMYGKKDVESMFRFTHHRSIPLSECSVEASIDEDEDGFVIHAKAKSFKVVAGSKHAKQRWLECIQRELTRTQNVQEFAPVWNQDTESCERCNASFTIVNRRHHCRNCGKCVCHRCSQYHRVLAFTDEIKAKRVCVECVNQLDKLPT